MFALGEPTTTKALMGASMVFVAVIAMSCETKVVAAIPNKTVKRILRLLPGCSLGDRG